jgi:chemotaxis protein MotB
MKRAGFARIGVIPLVVGVLAVGCVCNKKYKKQADKAAEMEARLKDEKKETKKLKKRVEELKQEGDSLKENLAKAKKDKTAASADASAEEKEKLTKLREEAKVQEKLLKDLTERLGKLIGTRRLSLKIVHGRMVLKLRSKVLFDSGKAELKKGGKVTLEQVAKVLKKIRGRHFQVAGHTDNQPIRKSKFPSNWDLGAARAVQVVKFLQEKGVPGGRMSAAGFSYYQSVASNAREWGRRRNRRIEISLLPSIPSRLLKKAAKLGKEKGKGKGK